MASFLELIDNALGTHFATPVYDPAKGREKMVKVISKAAEQHKNGQTPATRSWKLGNNNAIRFSPKISGASVLIAGEADNYVQAERFQDFLAALKAAVEAGDLDQEIKAALDGEEPSKLGLSRKRGAAKASKYPADHPATLDPEAWSAMSNGDKIKAGVAYRKANGG